MYNIYPHRNGQPFPISFLHLTMQDDLVMIHFGRVVHSCTCRKSDSYFSNVYACMCACARVHTCACVCVCVCWVCCDGVSRWILLPMSSSILSALPVIHSERFSSLGDRETERKTERECVCVCGVEGLGVCGGCFCDFAFCAFSTHIPQAAPRGLQQSVCLAPYSPASHYYLAQPPGAGFLQEWSHSRYNNIQVWIVLFVPLFMKMQTKVTG